MTTTNTVTATLNHYGQTLTGVPVLNPGDGFGKCWLLEIGGSYTPLYLIVEADTVADAIDVLADNAQYGDQIRVDDACLGDYPKDSRLYSSSGHVLDLDHLQVHGDDRHGIPGVRYFGEGLPKDGVEPCIVNDVRGKPYRLTLSMGERVAIDWIGDSYAHGEQLYHALHVHGASAHDWNHSGDVTYYLDEATAHAVRELCEEDGMACFAEGFRAKLRAFCEKIV